MATVYGYARVSSRDQNLNRQLDALGAYGVGSANIYADHASGKDFDRPHYRELLHVLGDGDVLVVLSIDRLGRNYSEILEEWRRITKELGVAIVVLDMPLLDTTGLALEDIARVNLRLAALGFEIMAFVPGDANVRGPVFEGLPTVEAQRGRASKVALNMLELAHGADCDIVLVGDPDLSDAGWAQFAQVSAGYVDLQCELEPGYAYVRGQIHHDRPDSSVLIFRSQESRTTLKPDSVPTDAGAGLPRKAGSIAVSNSGYGRYEGELEIARVDLPGDERMNVAGHITPEAMELLPFIKRGFGVRFV